MKPSLRSRVVPAMWLALSIVGLGWVGLVLRGRSGPSVGAPSSERQAAARSVEASLSPRAADSSAPVAVSLDIDDTLASLPIDPTKKQILRDLADALHIDPRCFRYGEPPYRAARSLSPQEYADLAKVLAYPDTHPRVLGRAIFLFALASRGNEGAADVIRGVIERPEDWSPWSDPHDLKQALTAKSSALEMLGLIGTEQVKEYLRRAITPEGATDLSKRWLADLPRHYSRSYGERPDDSPIESFRRRAVLGLAWFGEDREVRALIESEWVQERQRLMEIKRPTSPYYTGLLGAMARIHYLRDYGLEAYTQLYDQPAPPPYNNAMEHLHVRFLEFNQDALVLHLMLQGQTNSLPVHADAVRSEPPAR